MSMICKYRTLTADEAHRVRRDEDYLLSLTDPVFDVETAAMTREAGRWLRLALQSAPRAAGGGIDGVLTLSPAPSGAEDEGDSPGLAAEIGEEPRGAVEAAAPRVEAGAIHGVVFRFASPQSGVGAIPVTLPQVDQGAASGKGPSH